MVGPGPGLQTHEHIGPGGVPGTRDVPTGAASAPGATHTPPLPGGSTDGPLAPPTSSPCWFHVTAAVSELLPARSSCGRQGRAQREGRLAVPAGQGPAPAPRCPAREPRPGRAPGGPRRESGRISPTHTRGRYRAPPSPSSRGRARTPPFQAHPGTRCPLTPAAHGTVPVHPLSLHGAAPGSPLHGSVLGSAPHRGQSPPGAAHGAGAACPAGTTERGAPAPPLPTARINNKMAAPERAGPGAGRHSNRAVQSPPRRPARANPRRSPAPGGPLWTLIGQNRCRSSEKPNRPHPSVDGSAR